MKKETHVEFSNEILGIGTYDHDESLSNPEVYQMSYWDTIVPKAIQLTSGNKEGGWETRHKERKRSQAYLHQARSI